MAHQTQEELAVVLDDLGRHDEATRLRAKVRESYEGLGADAWFAALDRAATSVRTP